MNYKTFAPHPLLANAVKCCWTLDAPASPGMDKQRIVPDGCMEMIFHYGDHFFQFLEDETAIVQPKSFVFGQITVPLTIAPSGVTGVFAVRFHPQGFSSICNPDPAKMKDKATPLADLFGDEGSMLETSMMQDISTDERIVIIENFLVKKYAFAAQREKLASASVELLWKSKGRLSMEQLTAGLDVNKRMLQRKFSSTIGLSPKQLSKIIRLQSALRCLIENPPSSLTGLAYENGYYDQAHFIKEFKEFTGTTPGQFYSEQLKLAVLFSGND